MWSGPRNISTALMRAFENRDDCAVVDEPLYGFYLRETGFDHPGAAEIIAAMDCDWQSVVHTLCEEPPPGGESVSVFYQKHMSQHLLPQVDYGFTERLENCFLIREPRRMIASYARIRPEFTLEELGLPQQRALFRREAERLGEAPPVLDAGVTLRAPGEVLRALCGRLSLPFSKRMLRWPPGRRASDGVWARHWYASVEASTGWVESGQEEAAAVSVPARYEPLCAEAEAIYAEMVRYALTPA